MKKYIKKVEDKAEEDYILEHMDDENSNQKPETIEQDEQLSQKTTFDFSFSAVITYLFIILFIIAFALKFIFPSINSIEANIKHRKIGKSIVYNFFDLLENSDYESALNLLDINNANANVDYLINMLKSEFGTTKILDCDILNIFDKDDYSVVETMISYENEGKVFTKNKSLLLRNTPEGWKITLTGLIKSFKIEPFSATFDNAFTLTLDEIEYCVEGVNLKLKVENHTYKKKNMRGKMELKTVIGTYPIDVNTVLKPKVKYEHNFLFYDAEGEPIELVISFEGRDNLVRNIPIKIKEKGSFSIFQ